MKKIIPAIKKVFSVITHPEYKRTSFVCLPFVVDNGKSSQISEISSFLVLCLIIFILLYSGAFRKGVFKIAHYSLEQQAGLILALNELYVLYFNKNNLVFIGLNTEILVLKSVYCFEVNFYLNVGQCVNIIQRLVNVIRIVLLVFH